MLQFNLNKDKSIAGYRNVGEFIKLRRRLVNLSQEALAKKLGYKNGQYISNVERGLCMFPMDKLYSLSKLLHVDIELIADQYAKDSKEKVMEAFKKASSQQYEAMKAEK